MSQPIQVADGTSNPQIVSLPMAATANDLRSVVQYLSKRPEGVTLGEAADAIKKQVFESVKINAYISLGVITQSSDRLKLDALGWEMARALEPEAHVFRAILEQTLPYRAVLDWAHQQKVDVLTQPEVARHWNDHYPDVLGISTKLMEGGVGCFFQLCQAAALGTYIIGKKGQPSRLRLERHELSSFLLTNHSAKPTEPPTAIMNYSARSRRDILKPNESSSVAHEPEGTLMYVSATHDGEKIARQIEIALNIADIDCVISQRCDTDSMLVLCSPQMRRCNAGIIIVTSEDCGTTSSGECSLKESLRIEIAAAHLLYRHSLIVLWGLRLPELEDFTHLKVYRLEEGDLTLNSAAQITHLIKEFRRSVID